MSTQSEFVALLKQVHISVKSDKSLRGFGDMSGSYIEGTIFNTLA